ncbi:hypothetical protein PGT21_015087 [Puccinia graminis f. sp. tritici]|uniref:Uncharacterized protein n=1 Tax=Puccinia graminis f. sp. tritici TaxID=56615 RepID=A0A5B0RC03_PUCGR|nr:hypothetical protein PGT21_015087 [Puccinia graminis f. sp. tritici]KAA1121476.1 hypothetical protein PGTUg99_028392 [Puccinia graminis f. sp. tritici]KAA1122555.1 hypothetical protein PGTUg99_037786 [Puccinia graminis f. sp. tritici]
MVHQSISITLVVLSMLMFCCTGQPITSATISKPNEPTRNLLSKRKVKEVGTNTSNNFYDKQIARGPPF